MTRGPQVRGLALLGAMLLASALVLACSGDEEQRPLTVYAGRSELLMKPLLEQFSKDTGIPIKVRYGDGTDLALGILEEGRNSPADVYLTQDVGALGALQAESRLTALPESTLTRVPAAFRSPDGQWVGLSGRARVIVYNTDAIDPSTLPPTIFDYTKPEWRGRLGIVPRSDGFPEFVTALRLTRGEAFARQWLLDLKANAPRIYPNNIAAITAVKNREIEAAFLNHYYLYRFLAEEGPGFKVRNYYFDNGDLGGLFLVSGAGVLDSAANPEAGRRFIAYLLEKSAQEYFAAQTHEYPLVAGVAPGAELPALASLKTPDIDLGDIQDLRGSLELMRTTGIIP
ncbi:MAG: iron ABC transporter substrate-binding protein [Dehalococcoidia bacterium]|nr:iron ABC transporter substrate-binding protein [Dehalococcoidia bacterium]